MGDGLRGAGEGHRVRARGGMFAAVLSAAVAVATLLCSSALALSQRGHVFEQSFGSAAPSALSSIAIDERTHEVFVVNRVAEEVERFKPGAEGRYEQALPSLSVPDPGFVAVDNSREPAEKDPSEGDVYVSSTGGTWTHPKGAIYKFSSTGAELAKITKTDQEESIESLGRIFALEVSATGVLWVEQEPEFEVEAALDRLSPHPPKAGTAQLLSEKLEPTGTSPVPGFAVDSGEEDIYLAVPLEERGEAVEEEEEEKEATHKAPRHRELCEVLPCMVSKFSLEVGEDGPEGTEVLLPDLVSEQTNAVAVDLFGSGVYRDDAYLASPDQITEFDSAGRRVQAFGLPEGAFPGLQEATGVAVESNTESQATTGKVFVVDAKAGDVDVFAPASAAAPTVDSVSATEVSSRSARMSAQVDAHGAQTSYTFQYSTTAPASCPSGSPSCEAPVGGGQLIGSFGDQTATASLTGLAPGTTYHYVAVVRNALGEARSTEGIFTTPPLTGAEAALPDGRAWELVSPSEKHGASIEPMRFDGGAIQAAADGDAIAYFADAPVATEPAGNVSYEPDQVVSMRGARGWESTEITTPAESAQGVTDGGKVPGYALFSPNLSLALLQPFTTNPLAEPPLAPPVEPGETQEATIYLAANPLLAPEAPVEAIYDTARHNGETMEGLSRENGTKIQSPGYLALVTHADEETTEPFGSELRTVGASANLAHVVFESVVPLLPRATASSIYEWAEGEQEAVEGKQLLHGGREGQLKLVSEVNGVGSEGKLGAEGENLRHAISEDGLRVFWSEREGANHLYMRDTARERTIQLDTVRSGSGEGKVHAVFELATPDGSRVLFTDTQRLTAESGQAAGSADLYECEITSEDNCVLTDLTPEHEGSSAAVQGLVLGATETEADPSRIYFVANGVLSDNENARGEEATPGDCVEAQVLQPLGAGCNLYVREPNPKNPNEDETRFIARLSNEDIPDWGPANDDISKMTSRVSPNGEYLAFMSDRSLTGYDNLDANSGEPDEEVYLYRAGAEERLVCASCNPSGARPTGVFDTPEAGEGKGLLVDRREVWSTEKQGVDHWLAGSVPGWTPIDGAGQPSALYQSRYLSDSGRLFFDSSDALVPQDANEKEDVYEYEPPGVGGCTGSAPTFSGAQEGCIALISSGESSRESAFLDASETGSDVFFLTAAQLVPSDRDDVFDVYDAHECTSASPCLAPEVPSSSSHCESEEACRGSFTAPPLFGAPSSTTFSGAGNVVPTAQSLPFKAKAKPLTRAQRLAKALKSCRTKRNRRKRAACERQARKKYGRKPKEKKRSSKHSARKGK